MKWCSYCWESINENKKDEKYVINIAKQGKKTIAFEIFHVSCWKKHLMANIKKELEKDKINTR